MFAYEMIWGLAIVVLGVALAWAFMRYKTRDRSKDEVTERATRELYRHPDTYDEKRSEFERQARNR